MILSTVSGQFCIKPSMAFPWSCSEGSKPRSPYHSRIEPPRRPVIPRRGAREHQPFVQSECAVAPEFDAERRHAIAEPVWRARHGAQAELQAVFGDAFSQG